MLYYRVNSFLTDQVKYYVASISKNTVSMFVVPEIKIVYIIVDVKCKKG